jgi:uncharacterized protein (TIGR02996 family)
MPSDEAHLLSVVCTEADDTSRLVYADWLNEHDQAERARYIRLSVEASRLPPADPRRFALFAEAETLLNEHFEAWEAAMPDLPGVAWLEYERGFIVQAIASVEALLTHGDSLFAASPIRELDVRVKSPEECEALAGWPGLARLRDLTLTDLPPGNAAAPIFNSPYLDRLQRLGFDHVTLGPRVLQGLGDTSRLPGVKSLSLYGTRFTHRWPEALAPRLACLTSLCMVGTGVNDPAAEVLADHATRLTHLQFGGNGLSARGAEILCRATAWTDLEDLTIGQLEQCGPGLAHAVAGATHWQKLRTLQLYGHDIDDSGAAALAASPVCAGLVGLDLSINEITDAGAIALARSPHLGQLCWLRLGNNPGISPAGHAALRERFGDRV